MQSADARTYGTLLVVEDDPNMIDVLNDILTGEGYLVVKAGDGVEALDVLSKMPNAPDMIIADIMMPRMDGFELLRRIRAEEAWMHVPFTFLTARDNPSDMVLGKTLGADEYIPKPFDIEDFLKVIAARLRRYRSLARVQTDRMQELKREILQLLNHEFRTPLTLIVAYANMVKEFDPATTISRDQLIEFLGNVNSGAQRLRRLIENFILLAELQHGDGATSLSWRMRRVDDPRGLFLEALDNVTRDRTRHDFQIQVSDGLPRFTGDSESLVIALRELIDNAIKFSPEGTPIMLSAAYKDGHITLSVQDHGRGIPSDQLAKIGAAFYQIDRRSTEDQGVGAGLAIVDAIAKLHDARVHVTSTAGHGTTVELVMPLDAHI